MTPLKNHDPFLWYASEIEMMTDSTFDAYGGEEQFEIQMEKQLACIAENPNHDDTPDMAADWLRNQMKLGKCDPAGRLSRAIKSGKVRTEQKRLTVLFAVAGFLREHRRWPQRSEIVIDGVSERTRDLVFEEIGEKFKVKHELDGREKGRHSQ